MALDNGHRIMVGTVKNFIKNIWQAQKLAEENTHLKIKLLNIGYPHPINKHSKLGIEQQIKNHLLTILPLGVVAELSVTEKQPGLIGIKINLT